MENEFARRKEVVKSGRTVFLRVVSSGALFVLVATVVGGTVPPTATRIGCEANSAVNLSSEIKIELPWVR
jgi:hypothetical protein